MIEERFAGKHDPKFHRLLAFLSRVAAIETDNSPYRGFGSGVSESGCWWVKFRIEAGHPLAWSKVQELGHVLNYLSPDERLPKVFMPASPPPYVNGGPEFLSWVIESKDSNFSPDQAAEWLEGRLPRPVEDPAKRPINQNEQD